MNYIEKFKGQKAKLPEKINLKDIFFAWIGALFAIGIIGYLTKEYNNLLVMGSFGASCVLLFAYPLSPFSQPRNVIFGHLLSTFIGLSFLHIIGPQWWSMALALATAISIMLVTRTVHPPAGSNPLIVFLLSANWEYLVFPSLIGSLVLVFVALIYNNLHKKRTYPSYWF